MQNTTAPNLIAFTTMGVLTTVQDLSRIVIPEIGKANPEKVVEETMCLAATVSARELETSSTSDDLITDAMLSLPFLYRDYFFGGAMLLNPESVSESDEQASRDRLTKIMVFYTTQFPKGQALTRRVLADKMALWMGRISPPGLAEKPIDRLNRLDLVSLLYTHLRLIRTFNK